jgi:hypothetical protein
MSAHTGYSYYSVYKNDPEKKIPLKRSGHMCIRRDYTQEQIENLIGYINSDKMTLKEASTKVHMTYRSSNYYYAKYLKHPNHNISRLLLHQTYTQDQKSAFIDYVINDKMSIRAASKKANMSAPTANKYYHQYLKNQQRNRPT